VKKHESIAKEALRELREAINSPIYGGNGQQSAAIKTAVDKYIEDKVYDADKKAELGYHVDAIMRYFKDLK